jgi:hypothetical protein
VLRHGYGPRPPPCALDLAVGQSSCMCGRPRRAGQSMPLNSPSPLGELLCVSQASTRACLLACISVGCRTSPHRQRRVCLRLTGECAARHARERKNACVPSQRTPALGRGLAFGSPSRTPPARANLLGVASRRAQARKAKAGTLPARHRPGMPWAFRRALGDRGAGKGV